MQLTKQQICDELWRRDEISWKLHEGQRKIHTIVHGNDSWLVQNMCARQFGKTVYNLWEATQDCLKYPGTVVKYGAAYYEDLQKYIFPTAHEFFADCPKEIRPEIVESKKLIYFPHKRSTIDFFGCDRNPDGARGPKVKTVILDEAGYIEKLRYMYYDVVVPMFTHTQGLNPKCIMAGTPPESPDHPFTSFFMPITQKQGTFIKLTIDDNPLLTQAQKDRLIAEYFMGVETELHRVVQHQKMRRELYCDLIIDREKAIIPEWQHKYEQTVVKDKYFQFHHKYVAMDLGVVDKTVALFGYYDFASATLYITHECQMWGPTMTTKDLAQLLKETERKAFGNHKVHRRISDNDLLLTQDLSITYKIPFLTVDKKRLHKMINKVRLWVNAGRVIIDPSCREIIGCLNSGIWDKNREEFERSESYGHFDALAALTYMIQMVDDKTNPIPFHFEKNLADMHIFEKEKPGLDKFKKIMAVLK